jgi:DNA-binding SARP family transcriptional activator
MEARTLQLHVLGPTRVFDEGRLASLRPREADLLVALGLEGRKSVAAGELAHVLWTIPPPSARKTIQNHVARVRAVLGATAIDTDGSSYRLGQHWQTDIDTFLELCRQADRDGRVGDFDGQRARLATALGLIRGMTFESIELTGPVRLAQRRMDRQIEQARESYLGALIETARYDEASRAAADFLETNPGRETLWVLRAIALLRKGDRRAAIEALQLCRRTNREASGLSVGHAVQRLESLALADDPAVFRLSVATLIDSAQPIAGYATASEQFFVGRTEQLAALDSVIARARRNRSTAVVAVEGVTGSGRSAFGRRAAILSSADGCCTAHVSCRPVAVRPLEPFGEALGQLLQQVNTSGAVTDQSRLIAQLDVVAAVQSPAATRPGVASIAEDVVRLFQQVCAVQPVVLVIDNGEFLRPSSVRVLEELQLAAEQLVVVLLGSPRELRIEPTIRLPLGALSEQEIDRLYFALVGSSIDTNMLSILQTTSNGLPGSLREVILESMRGETEEGTRAELPGQMSKGEVQFAALTRAESEVIDLCCIVALAATPPSTDLLFRVGLHAGLVHPAVLLADAVARGLVLTTDSVGLRVASEVLAGQVLARCGEHRVTELHEAWWLTLDEDQAPSFSVVEHAVAAASKAPRRAIDSLDSAQAAAVANGMFLEAAEFERRAIDVLMSFGGEQHEMFRRRLNRCELNRQGGDSSYPDELWNIVEDAASVNDEVVLAQAGGLLCALGPSTRFGIADDKIADLVERVVWKCPDPGVRSRAHAQASLFYSSTDFVRCEQHLSHALADARLTADPETLAYVLGFISVTSLDPDHLAQRTVFAEELVLLAERLDSEPYRLEAIHALYNAQIQRADPMIWLTERALRSLDSGILGRPQRWMANYMQISLTFLRGQIERAESMNEQVLSMLPVHRSRSITNYTVQLFGIRLSQGRSGELNDIVRSIVVDQPLAPAWQGFLAFTSVCVGDLETVLAACDATDNGRMLPRDIGWMGGVWLLARAAARAGLVESALDLSQLLIPYSEQMTWVGVCTFGPVDLAIAELASCLGDREAASRALHRAKETVRRLSTSTFDHDIALTQALIGL